MTGPAVAARPLRALWGALTSGGLAALVVLTVLSTTQPTPFAEHRDAAFYACALYGTAALAVAFGLLHRMQAHLAASNTDAEALATIRGHGVAALAAVESSAVLAGLVMFMTGNVLALAFGAPLAAFAALTWPTEARVAGWLALRDR